MFVKTLTAILDFNKYKMFLLSNILTANCFSLKTELKLYINHNSYVKR